MHVLVAGKGAGAVAAEAAKLAGVAKVLLAECRRAGARPRRAARRADRLARRPYDALVAPATTAGKNVMPRVAALLDVMQVSDVTRSSRPTRSERPIYAGNAIQTVQSGDAKKVLTVRTAAFQAAERARCGAGRERRARRPIRACPPSSAESVAADERPELASAKIIISGGRALGSAREIHGGDRSRSPTSSARRSAPRAPRSTPATRRTTGRSARPARSSRRTSTSPAASPAPSSTSPA